jgi:hypothetical protein
MNVFKPFKPFKQFKPPPRVLPRDAGEDEGGGLNGAQRLNGLNLHSRRAKESENSYVRFANLVG